ncbi:MAG TPA: glycosyltransferase family 39 protein [Pirellulales bacterium]|nr:glycosyltransferase family 39 protein [Pirellulales bacterium]
MNSSYRAKGKVLPSVAKKRTGRDPTNRLAAFPWRGILTVLVLTGCATLAVSSALRTSVTVDEFAYLPMGISVWQNRTFDINSGTTPLPGMLAAAPVVLLNRAKLSEPPPGERSIWSDGSRFAADNSERYHECFMLGRLVSIFVLLGTGLLASGFARSLYGFKGGLIALVVVCFSPDMLAHGSLVTTDIYLAGAVLASLWAFDVLLQRPNWPAVCGLGVSVGAAMLCKFTGILLVLLLPAAALVLWACKRLRLGDDRESLVVSRKTVYWGIAALVLAILTIHVGYGFDRPLTLLGDFSFQTGAFQAIQAALPAPIPVPSPYAFVAGFDAQFSEGPYDAYLLGTFNQTGFWNYYLVGFLVKTPEPILLLVAGALLLSPKVALREVPMIVVVLAFFAIFSFTGHKNIGVRYLLFLIPIAAVWSGRLAASTAWNSPRHARALAAAVTVSLAGLAAIAVATWPYYLAYFNAASGGPGRGHEYLLDSNIDWGQDLIALRDYMQREGIESVDLAYFGRVDPAIYGIGYRPLIDKVSGRYVVISTNFLFGRMYFVGGSGFWPSNRDHYAIFRRLKPKAVLGHNLYVFDMTAQTTRGSQ